MKTKNFLAVLMAGLFLFSSCKKDDVQNQAATVTVNADGSLNVSDADGAFYTVVTKEFDTNNSSTFEEIHMAWAWAGKFPAVVNAGVVKANNIEIDNYGNFYTSIAVLSFGDTLFKGASFNTVWNIQGNSAAGISGFTHTDNTPLPPAPNFTLPASININNSLTISHSATGGGLGVLYTLMGSKGDTTKFVANTSTGITFSSAEVKSVALSNSSVSVSVMPLAYTSATHGGKKYYFVKQYQYGRVTDTQ